MLEFNFKFEIPTRGIFHASGQLPEGLRLAISGPSGCGKSTFLKTLCGLQLKREGVCTWNKQPLDRTALREGTLGFCFQSSPLFSHLNVVDNLTIPLQTVSKFTKLSSQLREERAVGILKKAGLENLIGKWPQNLSGGEKKRVTLLRALIYNPPLLVMDEPFSDLDPTNRALFKRWVLEQLTEGQGIVIFVSHQESDLENFATEQFVWPENSSELDFNSREDCK